MVAMTGMDSGSTMRSNTVGGEAPSTMAASNSSSGRLMKKVAHNQHIPGVDQAGENHRPERIAQAKRVDQQKARYQPATENHGDEDEYRQRHAAGQVSLSQGVSHGDREGEVEARPDNHAEKRDAVGIEDDFAAPEQDIVGAT